MTKGRDGGRYHWARCPVFGGPCLNVVDTLHHYTQSTAQYSDGCGTVAVAWEEANACKHQHQPVLSPSPESPEWWHTPGDCVLVSPVQCQSVIQSARASKHQVSADCSHQASLYSFNVNCFCFVTLVISPWLVNVSVMNLASIWLNTAFS